MGTISVMTAVQGCAVYVEVRVNPLDLQKGHSIYQSCAAKNATGKGKSASGVRYSPVKRSVQISSAIIPRESQTHPVLPLPNRLTKKRFTRPVP
jgi:hypothetical protein